MKTLPELYTTSKKYKKQLWRHFAQRKQLSAFLSDYEKYELTAMLMLSIEHPEELCTVLGTQFQDLERIINKPQYHQYKIEKKKGGFREISAPDPELKQVQRKLNYFLQAIYLCLKPEEVHGFVINQGAKGEYCNIRENAAIHTSKKFVLNLDLEDFFSGISGSRVLSMFSSGLLNYSADIATALALLTTYRGKLPTGAPTSPVISNFVCFHLDAQLREFAIGNNLAYTRYADDLTFSSNQPISSILIDRLRMIISQSGFSVNEKKVRLISKNRKQTVTGIVVNEKVNIDRKLLKMIRAMVYDVKHNGVESATRKHFAIRGVVDKRYTSMFMARLEGYINFVGQIRGRSDSLYLKLKGTTVVNNNYLLPPEINSMEHQIDFYEKFNSKTNSLKLAIISYKEANYRQATLDLDDFFYTNRHLYGEEAEIYDSLRTLVEYRIEKINKNQV